MLELVLASRNRKKIAEMQTLLNEVMNGEVKILSLDDIGFAGDIEENGTTFEENALTKALAAHKLSGLGAIADDSGLVVDALDGAPGVYSARFAGEHGDDEANNQKVFRLMENVPDEKRTGRFVSVIACVLPGAVEPIVVRGEAEGIILREYRGEGGFGYDPMFYYPPLDKTFAQLTHDEKNAVSHRGNAMREFIEVFRKQMEGKN